MKDLAKNGLVAIISAFVVYFNVSVWKSPYIGWGVLLLFCWYFGGAVHKFFQSTFNFSSELKLKILSSFFVLFFLGSITAVIALVYEMGPVALALGFFISGVVFSFLKICPEAKTIVETEKIHEDGSVINYYHRIGIFLFSLFVGVWFVYLNLQGKPDAIIFNPWEHIGVVPVLAFYLATTILGLLIFTKLNSKILLLLIIIHSWMLHSYLPLVSSTFLGGDGWRHLATQASWWNNGTIVAPALNEISNFWQRMDFGLFAYGQFNSLSLIFQKLVLIDGISFVRNFMPLIWPVIFTLCVYEIAKEFGAGKKGVLFLLWMLAWPFAIQVSGSFTLPSNLSFLFWLMALLLQIKHFRNYDLKGAVFLFFLGFLFLFGHSLYFLLYWISFALLFICKKYDAKIVLIPTTILAVLFFPIIELISKYSIIKADVNWFFQVKLLIANFTAWYIPSGLRTSDITTGNVFFNQPPLHTVSNLFFTDGGILITVMLWFWLMWILAAILFLKSKNYLEKFWIILTTGLFGGYLISRYFLGGENIFTRRMDVLLAILFLVPVGILLYDIYTKIKIRMPRTFVFVYISLFSIIISTSFYLGPDASSVSYRDYQSMQTIWSVENNKEKVCVLADTMPLLALEEISARKVIGGGFPINSYFAQPERVTLLKLSKTDPKLAVIEAKNLLGTDYCYINEIKDGVSIFNKY